MMVTMMVLMMVTIVVLMMVTIVVLMMVTMMVLMMATYGSIPRTQIQKVFCRGPVCEQWVHQNGHINSYSGSNLIRSL